MQKNRSRFLALILSLVMVFSLAVPAFAASGQVNVTFADGSTTTLVNTPDIVLHTIGETDVGSVVVSNGEVTDTYTDFSSTIAKTLTGGTRYQIYTNTDSNGVKTLRFRYLNTLSDVISITVTAKDVTYKVNANSGALGQNSNQGGAATCEMNASSSTTVDGGSAYAVTFTPRSGQEIVKLNLRTGAADASGKIVTVAPGSVTVNGQVFYVSVTTDGKVTVKAEKVIRDLFITALTSDETVKYILSATSDVNCVADIGTEMVSAGTAKKVTFSPAAGYIVTDITITDGVSSATLSLNNEGVYVSGRRYTVTRNLDGSAVLSVPAMASNVYVSAVAASDVHYVNVLTDDNVQSNKSGVNYVETGSSFDCWYLPTSADVTLYSIAITTASAGTRLYAIHDAGWVDADGNLLYIPTEYWFNGTYWEQFSSGTVYFYTDANSYLHVRIKDVQENIEIALNSYDAAHEVKVSGDKGASFTDPSYTVATGDCLNVTFTPANQAFSIKALVVTTGGSTFRLSATDGVYKFVNNGKWVVTVGEDGAVTLTMNNICADAAIYAETNYLSSRTMSVSRSADAHSTISLSGNNPASSADTVSIAVRADSGYVLSSVTFRVGTSTAVVYPFDATVTVAGCTYDLQWTNSSSLNVIFAPLPGSMSISSVSKQGVTEEPVTTPDYSFHPAFMLGVGNNCFEPSRSLTRAEAITLLDRAVLHIVDADVTSYAAAGSFTDVPASFWGAGHVNYAKSRGLLGVLTSNNTLQPNKAITRAEFLALLCIYSNVDVSNTSTQSVYTDVASSHWAIKYINYGTDMGWVGGVGNGRFEPDRSVTRAEICAMVNRIMGRTADSAVMAATGATFNDVPLTHWAYADIFEASHAHYATITNGLESWS